MEATVATHPPVAAAAARRKPFYRTLWGQVLLGVAVGIVLGLVSPSTGEAMQPLGVAFIRLITRPNLALQSLTTREPDLEMLAVSIAAFKEVLEAEASQPVALPVPATD